MAPTLSIIIPVYNVERYLADCLNSALAQDVPGLEIICVNDGSTDSSPDILQQFASEHECIRVINKENAGYGAAMNDGLRAARGTYVGILESDDMVCDGAWSHLYGLATAHDADMVRGTYIRCYHGTQTVYDPHRGASGFCAPQQPGLPLGEVFDPADYPVCFWVNPSLWTGVYRRSFLMDNDIWFTETPGASYQDTAFGFKTWALATRVMLTDQPVILYNRDNEASSSNSKSKVFAICDEAAECERFIAERNLSDRLGPALASLRFRTYQWNAQRVGEEFKQDFAEVMWRELSEDYRAGFCSPDLFKRGDYELIRRHAEDTLAVSVVFAANGTAADNRAALECLTAFTSPDIEIFYIPCEDTDESDATDDAAPAASDDPRLRFLPPCPSTDQAFNAGIEEARGTYLMFVEAADRPEPRLLEYFVRAADREDLDAILCRWLYKSQDRPSIAGDPLLDWPRHHRCYSGTDPRGYVLRFDTALLANKLFRTSFLAEHRLTFPSADSAVASFAAAALTAAERAMVLPGRIVTHRGEALFSADPDALRSVADAVRQQMEEQGLFEENALDYQSWLAELNLYGFQVRSNELAETKRQLATTTAQMQHALDTTREKLSDTRARAKERNAELRRTRKSLQKTEAALADAQRDLEKLRASRSYRVGHTLTAPARAVKRALNHSAR